MKKFFIVLLLLALHFRLSAQQFSQYNTGTLYDSFENPTQKAFTPDSSRIVAFNMFLPNFSFNAALSGDAVAALKSRAFLGKYDNNPLTIGQQKLNYVSANFNAYEFMFKIYASLDGDKEMGFFMQTKGEGKGVFQDETIQLVSDYTAFNYQPQTNLYNSRFYYQAYNQIGFTYRENIDDQFAFGLKLSALMGVIYNKVNIDHSYISFDKANDRAFLSMSGQYQSSFIPGNFGSRDFLPTFRSPGASISMGAAYETESKVKMQWNLKDLGFIHWSSRSQISDFNNTGIINNLSMAGREDSIFKTASSLVQNNAGRGSFTTYTDARLEFSAAKSYWLGYNSVKYTPTLVMSKELLYTGFTTALVNHFQHNNLVFTLTGAYDDHKVFSFGTQFMIKSPNAEFFIGSDQLPQTISFTSAALSKSTAQAQSASQYAGMNFYMGFSIKLGQFIEHPLNASSIPMGDKSFIGRLINRLFKKSY